MIYLLLLVGMPNLIIIIQNFFFNNNYRLLIWTQSNQLGGFFLKEFTLNLDVHILMLVLLLFFIYYSRDVMD